MMTRKAPQQEAHRLTRPQAPSQVATEIPQAPGTTKHFFDGQLCKLCYRSLDLSISSTGRNVMVDRRDSYIWDCSSCSSLSRSCSSSCSSFSHLNDQP